MTETKEQEMLRYLYSHQYVVPVVYRAIEWQSRHGTPFKWYDVRAMQKDLDRMVLDGVLTKKGSKGYLLTDIKTATDAYLTYVAAVRAVRQERIL